MYHWNVPSCISYRVGDITQLIDRFRFIGAVRKLYFTKVKVK